ncbi:hypothetical protein NG99_09600 [Erwinia typographi]|uniref:Type II secretion system protein K n=1 Tax=Erwinia typographi TaxID=371042 RepID=A0A0A3Z9S6_9GAMM|nr:type II secretion system minor pseudopilin GspK [Erwinia typographi]KGT94396.1 hypothetical protein NG99_09600 [Erwinia typographi]
MSNQKGSALLMVLLMMALILSVAVLSNEYWQQTMIRSHSISWQTQMKWTLLGNEKILKNTLEKQQKIAADSGLLLLDGVQIRYETRDLGGCFNLNSLIKNVQSGKNSSSGQTESQKERVEKPDQKGSDVVDEGEIAEPESAFQNEKGDAVSLAAGKEQPLADEGQVDREAGRYPSAVFAQLLVNVTGMSDESAKNITQAIERRLNPVNGISEGKEKGDSASQQRGTGAEAAAHVPMLDSSELRTVEGIDQKSWQQLRDWVCALPESALLVNINALRPDQGAMLAALFVNSLSVSEANRLISTRPAQGWQDSAALMAAAESKSNVWTSAIKKTLVQESHYFSLSQWVLEEEGEYSLRSLFREENNQLHIIQRRYGVSESY